MGGGSFEILKEGVVAKVGDVEGHVHFGFFGGFGVYGKGGFGECRGEGCFEGCFVCVCFGDADTRMFVRLN